MGHVQGILDPEAGEHILRYQRVEKELSGYADWTTNNGWN